MRVQWPLDHVRRRDLPVHGESARRRLPNAATRHTTYRNCRTASTTRRATGASAVGPATSGRRRTAAPPAAPSEYCLSVLTSASSFSVIGGTLFVQALGYAPFLEYKAEQGGGAYFENAR